MATNTLNQRESHVRVTSAELSVLLGDKAKQAGLIPADFTVTDMRVVPEADSGFTLQFIETTEA